ncbi:MAG: hypothetical protein HXY40_14225 [Chloroflexi bacterium]|nr:hypothetical protein [Chloroflexota bacterium]
MPRDRAPRRRFDHDAGVSVWTLATDTPRVSLPGSAYIRGARFSGDGTLLLIETLGVIGMWALPAV